MIILKYILTTILLSLVNSAGDRLRGTSTPEYQAGTITAGTIFTLCMAYYMPNGWQVLVVEGWGFLLIAAYMLGEAPGWGEPLGSHLTNRKMDKHDLEWWQFGFFKRNAIYALTFRGMMWGLPVSLATSFIFGSIYGCIVFTSFTLSMPWAADFARMFVRGNGTVKWERGETIRGAMLITLIAAGVAMYRLYLL